MAFLRLPSVWLCFSFFFFSTCALAAMQSFASPALGTMYGLPLDLTALVITGYMLFGAAGMVAGGFLVSRVQRLERTIGVAMCAGAVLLALVGTGWLPGVAALWVAAIAGAGTGVAGPSRDMLIKRAAPPGATGRVYGTVYSGLDLGFSVAAPVFGALLDRGMTSAVFYGAALALVLGVGSAGMVGAGVAARLPHQRAAA
jgi:MFS family permease